MENFIVSARKYRPATFDTVVGQESITTTLKNAIRNNQLAQAFLFCGPRGVGKTTCARILAKTINCFHPVNQVEPCDQCESCVSFNRSASFNIHELDAASNNSVDDIRNLVDQVRIPPQVGKYKVYIIDEVHMLSQQAFNAFLKTLEEPPSYAKFILATTEKHKIIPTILSRCQIFDFKRISVKDIAAYLEFVAKNEGVEASEEALHMIAQKADGALRDALSFFDQLVSVAGSELTYETVIEHLNILDYTYYFKIIDQLLQHDTAGTLMTINEINDRGFDGQHFIIGFGEHLRNLLVCKDQVTLRLLEVSPAVAAKYTEQSAACSMAFLLKALEINNHCDLNYKSSNNKRLLLELSLLQMCSIASGHAGSDEKKNILIPPGAKEVPVKKVASEAPEITDTSKHRHGVQGKPEINQLINPTPGEITIQDKNITQRPQGSPTRSRTISIKPENHVGEPNGNMQQPVMEPKKQEQQLFSQEQLDKVWAYYTESIARQYPNFYSILTSRKPVLKEDSVIDLVLYNKVEDLSFQPKKPDLLDFLRTELRNFKISVNVIIEENGDVSKPYTADEKYRAMIAKNPTLKDLKDKLDLEVEL
jgi:DNA polymerase-3 subunit gamma/tau